jgi:hypothetical protein
MGFPFPKELALESLEHPETPESAYAFTFEDYLVKVSAAEDIVQDFLGRLAFGEQATLWLKLNAIGAFSGRSEFDANGHVDQYDSPRPGQTWFQNLPNVVVEPERVEAALDLSREDSSRTELVSNQEGSGGQSLTVWGGNMVLNGHIEVPGSSEFSAKISEGYTSSKPLKLNFWTREREAVGPGERWFAGTNIVMLERVYASEPQQLDQPYD